MLTTSAPTKAKIAVAMLAKIGVTPPGAKPPAP
jgi:hypothetical protein